LLIWEENHQENTLLNGHLFLILFVSFSFFFLKKQIVHNFFFFLHITDICQPFILGFMKDSCELRSLLNGTLIQSLPLTSTTLLCFSQKSISLNPSTLHLNSSSIFVGFSQSLKNSDTSQIQKLTFSLPKQINE